MENLLDTAHMPVWARVIGFLGFPVVVASSLLWVFTDQIRGEHTLLIEHNELMKSHSSVAVQQYINTVTIGSASLRALSQICANGAKTKEERDACASVVIPMPSGIPDGGVPDSVYGWKHTH
jgi:hypothetical protein